MGRGLFGGAALAAVLCGPANLAAQNTPDGAAQDTSGALRNDSDPLRAILFSVRPEFMFLDNGVSRAMLIFRYDHAALRERRWLPGRRGVILRFEMPLARTQNNSDREVGLGDAYGQLLLAPYFTRSFAFVAGAGLTAPTATAAALGSGRWTVAPAAGPVWFFPGRGMFFIRLQNATSIGDDDRRPDINVFVVAPTFLHSLGSGWWTLLDAETMTDWRRGRRTSVKSGVQIGRAVGASLGIWVKPELWWGPNQDGRFNLKFGVVWYRP
jgi:hypothetical protein